MAKRRGSKVQLSTVEHESIGVALAAIGDLCGIPQVERILRVPACAAFLELFAAAQAVSDHTSSGRTREEAIDAAAGELGIPTETLRSRIKANRKKAFGTDDIGSDSNLPERRRAA